MGNNYARVPVLALVLLLLLPSPLLSKGAFHQSAQRKLYYLSQAWRNRDYRHISPDKESHSHRHSEENLAESEKEKPCQGDLDIYFILDKSGSVGNNWLGIYNFVENVLRRFPNPQTQVSFITYSTLGHTILALTSDNKKIQDGLNKLRNVVTTGATNMHEGFKQANHQIMEAVSAGRRRLPLLIVITDGTLLPEAFQATMMQAKDTQNLGGIIYTVGLGDYRGDQLQEIAGTEERVFGVNLRTTGLQGIEDIADPLAAKACVEVTAVEPSNFCTGEMYDVLVSGKGFSNTQDKNRVFCRFKISESKYYDQKATSVEDTSLKCPGVKIDEANQKITLEISLKDGISFISSDLGITSKDCMSSKDTGSPAAPPETPHDTPPAEHKNVPTFQGSIKIPEMNLYLVIPVVLLVLLLIFYCIYRYSCKKKRDQCVQPSPSMVVPHSGCPEGNLRRIEDKLDSLCNFVHCSNQRPILICAPKRKCRCTRVNPPRGRCGRIASDSSDCCQQNPECCPLNNCCMRCLQFAISCSQSPQSVCARPPQIVYTRLPSKMLHCSTKTCSRVPLPLPSP